MYQIIQMTEAERSYLPAAGKHVFLPFYDAFTKLVGADRARRGLLEQAELAPGQRVLDVGCGTGTLAVSIKAREPRVDVVGLDPDPNALERARRKARRAGVEVRFERGFADSLPFSDASFDRVLSSLMFHHLPAGEKRKALGEIARVLKPGGRLELMDFGGRDQSHHGRLHGFIHSHELLHDNAEDHVLELMTEAQLRDVRIVRRAKMFLGGIVYYQAER